MGNHELLATRFAVCSMLVAIHVHVLKLFHDVPVFNQSQRRQRAEAKSCEHSDVPGSTSQRLPQRVNILAALQAESFNHGS